MLKIIRESAIERPWFYRTLMGLIAAAFVISMGWWGFEQNKEDNVIAGGNDRVTRDEYQRTYQSLYRQYKELMQRDLPEEQIKQMVVDQLIASRLWSQAAKDMGVTVTPGELREAIAKLPEFQRNGKF